MRAVQVSKNRWLTLNGVSCGWQGSALHVSFSMQMFKNIPTLPRFSGIAPGVLGELVPGMGPGVTLRFNMDSPNPLDEYIAVVLQPETPEERDVLQGQRLEKVTPNKILLSFDDSAEGSLEDILVKNESLDSVIWSD